MFVFLCLKQSWGSDPGPALGIGKLGSRLGPPISGGLTQESANLPEDGDAGSCDADESQQIDFNWKDQGLWPPSIRNKERVYLVKKGPFRKSGSGIKYQQDKSSKKRHFSMEFFKEVTKL